MNNLTGIGKIHLTNLNISHKSAGLLCWKSSTLPHYNNILINQRCQLENQEFRQFQCQYAYAYIGSELLCNEIYFENCCIINLER